MFVPHMKKTRTNSTPDLGGPSVRSRLHVERYPKVTKLNYPRMKSFQPIWPKEGFPMILELGALLLTVHPKINPE